jgi:hypothetical protein
MGTSSLAALAGMGMIGILVMILVVILFGALILCVSFRFVVGYMPSYVRSIGAVLLAWIAAMAVLLVLHLIMPGDHMVLPGMGGHLLGLAAEFLISAAVINHLLLTQDGSKIGYGKACLVQLLYTVMFIVLGMLLAAIMAVIFGTSILAGLH